MKVAFQNSMAQQDTIQKLQLNLGQALSLSLTREMFGCALFSAQGEKLIIKVKRNEVSELLCSNMTCFVYMDDYSIQNLIITRVKKGGECVFLTCSPIRNRAQERMV